MSELPIYIWAMVLTGLIGTTATVCVMLWRGALDAGLRRGRATRAAGGFAILWGAWVLASVLLAETEVYRFEPTKLVPLLPVGLVCALAVALLLTRLPVMSSILSQPDALWRLTVPQIFRVEGAVFLIAMALGRLPAVFALPAGLGDIAIGVEAVFVARVLRRGVIGRSAVWFNILGLVDLVVAIGVGFVAAPAAVRLLNVSPSTEAISLLPLALIPATLVPLAAALHLLSLQKLKTPEKNPVASLVGSVK